MDERIAKISSSTTKLKDRGNDMLIRNAINTSRRPVNDKKYSESIKRVYDLYMMKPNNINNKKEEKPWATEFIISREYDSEDREKRAIREKLRCIMEDRAIIFLKSNRRKL